VICPPTTTTTQLLPISANTLEQWRLYVPRSHHAHQRPGNQSHPMETSSEQRETKCGVQTSRKRDEGERGVALTAAKNVPPSLAVSVRSSMYALQPVKEDGGERRVRKRERCGWGGGDNNGCSIIATDTKLLENQWSYPSSTRAPVHMVCVRRWYLHHASGFCSSSFFQALPPTEIQWKERGWGGVTAHATAESK
jgi:hypothetical protein